MTLWSEDNLPGLRDWQPLHDDTRSTLLRQPTDPAWERASPDDSRGGLPAIVVEVAWREPHHVRRIAMTGLTLDSSAADGVDDRELLEDLTVAIADVARTTTSLTDGTGDVTLRDGSVIRGLPDVLVAALLTP